MPAALLHRSRFPLCDATALERGAHAARADVEANRLAVQNQALPVNVRLEGAVGAPLRMADVVSKALGLAADLTLPGHRGSPFQLLIQQVWSDCQIVSLRRIYP